MSPPSACSRSRAGESLKSGSAAPPACPKLALTQTLLPMPKLKKKRLEAFRAYAVPAAVSSCPWLLAGSGRGAYAVAAESGGLSYLGSQSAAASWHHLFLLIIGRTSAKIVRGSGRSQYRSP